jgi:hypothetical protein
VQQEQMMESNLCHHKFLNNQVPHCNRHRQLQVQQDGLPYYPMERQPPLGRDIVE